MSWNDVEKKAGEEKDKIPYSKLEQGTTMIRVISEEPYSFWSHWLTKQNTSVTCLGKDCPICGIIAQQKANKQEKTYSSTQRHSLLVYNYTTKQYEILIQGKTFFSQLLTLHREIGDIRDYDIKIVRNGEGKNTTYTILPTAPKEFECDEEAPVVDFEEVFKPLDKSIVIQLMEGKSYEEIYNNSDNE